MRYSILMFETDTARSSAWSEALLRIANQQGITITVTVARTAPVAQFHAGRRQFHLLVAPLSDESLNLVTRLRTRSTHLRALFLHPPETPEQLLQDVRWRGYTLAVVPESPDAFVFAVSKALGLTLIDDPEHHGRPAATVSDVQVLLDVLRWQTKAQLVLYTDYIGNLITQRGDPSKLELDAISSLIAGSFGNSFELGRALHDPNTRHLSVLEGEQFDLYATNAGNYRLLALIFDKEFVSPKLGYVWLQLKRSADQLSHMRIVEGNVGEVIAAELTESLNNEFDRIFGSDLVDTRKS
ncbi:hypothetical protein OSCT_2555 [Oscillochloris trichoides DG-6]|uniref:Uncharacterized protein n=1 Tax=Oscillochloris trichoides DG-6 TaxID=765420 RepID=E1IGV4_9CHLR|nr:hypothetical protein [Oscillochloris trichoides]EFO79429.1 hypothetical protein OSCT_2555 [Oscillochloris trichoides DG-6]